MIYSGVGRCRLSLHEGCLRMKFMRIGRVEGHILKKPSFSVKFKIYKGKNYSSVIQSKT